MNRTRLEVVRGDITQVEADVIVNAANSGLLGGGGVDGAIHRAAGPALLAECRQILAAQGGCPPGQAVLTGAGRLPARYVVHTVGPIWSGSPGDEAILASCYRTSLKLAQDHGARTVAFPNIATGVYRFPKPLAAQVALRSVRSFLEAEGDPFEALFFVCFDAENEELYRSELDGPSPKSPG